MDTDNNRLHAIMARLAEIERVQLTIEQRLDAAERLLDDMKEVTNIHTNTIDRLVERIERLEASI